MDCGIESTGFWAPQLLVDVIPAGTNNYFIILEIHNRVIRRHCKIIQGSYPPLLFGNFLLVSPCELLDQTADHAVLGFKLVKVEKVIVYRSKVTNIMGIPS